MNKIIFILGLAVTLNAFAFTDQFLEASPNREYMSFILPRYIRALETEFGPRITTHDQKTHGLVTRLLSKLDHMQVDHEDFLPQFEIRFSLHHRRLFSSTRIFVQPDMRHEAIFLSRELPGLPVWYYGWDDDQRECVYLRRKKTSVSFSVWCRSPKQKTFREDSTEELFEAPTPGWPLVFPAAEPREIRVVRGGEVVEIEHRTTLAHPSRIPPELLLVAHFHQIKALFILRRYSTDREGNLTLHYP